MTDFTQLFSDEQKKIGFFPNSDVKPLSKFFGEKRDTDFKVDIGKTNLPQKNPKK